MLNKAVINLGEIKNNALLLKKKLNKGVKFCAVVKADAYGHGAEEVSSILYNTADCFAVALFEEAKRLRLCGIDKDILCLIPFFPSEVSSAVKLNLTATVYEKEHLKMLSNCAQSQGVKIKVHIKYDTGMNRQGVKGLENLKKLLDFAFNLDGIEVDGLYSHFFAPENKNALLSQVDKFLLANNLIKGYNNKVTCHISASGGFLSGVQMDMVRFGILLYGYKPFDSDVVSVKPALKVFAPVLSTKKLKFGERALYGGKIAQHDTDISLVRCGYADGIFRTETDELFNNRCMDVSAYRGELDGWACVMDDAERLAREHKTISYEILTNAAKRAEKIYLR
ncbi:MAG: alanine racemase [Clostridiales bacterium]|nr:alanine racemase [Clostridiales bacterium]